MIAIREYTTSDKTIIVDFISKLQDFEKTLDSTKLAGSRIGEDYFAYLLKNIDENNGTLFITEESSTPLGFVCVWIEKEDVQVTDYTEFGYISDLYVDEEARGKGVGKKLIERAVQYLKEKQMTNVHINALAANMCANGFYQKIGFKPVEIIFQKAI